MRCLTILAVVACGAAPLAAQDANTLAPYKDPGTGTLIGAVFPGGGQYYAGETGKGLVITGIAFAAPLVGALMMADDVWDCGSSSSLNCSVDEASTVPLWVGMAVGLGAWVYGAVDAAPAARRANVRSGAVTAQVVPYIGGQTRGVGLKIRVPLGL